LDQKNQEILVSVLKTFAISQDVFVDSILSALKVSWQFVHPMSSASTLILV
jgi:hypothetical protein